MNNHSDSDMKEMLTADEMAGNLAFADCDTADEERYEDEEQEMFEHFRFELDKGQAPMRVDKYLATHMENTSRHRIQLAIKEDYIRVNGKVAKANCIVRPGDVITFVMPYQRRGLEILPENIPLDIVYEDDDLLVLNKPAGLVVHPGHGHFSGTLVNALAYHLGISQGPDAEDERMGVLVHRIDTSDRMRFKVFPEGEHGKHAVTHYRVIERFGYVTVVECRLETGRTHQIRVHFNWIGHPLFNDERYDGAEIRKGTIYAKYRQFIENCFKLLPRQALHAKTLGFVHPRTKEYMSFDSPIPDDMQALIDKWRKYAEHLTPELE